MQTDGVTHKRAKNLDLCTEVQATALVVLLAWLTQADRRPGMDALRQRVQAIDAILEALDVTTPEAGLALSKHPEALAGSTAVVERTVYLRGATEAALSDADPTSKANKLSGLQTYYLAGLLGRLS